MADEKNWYQSRTIWGGIVAFGAAAAGFFGIDVDPGTQGELVTVIANAVAAIGAVVAIFGRFGAETTIR